MSENLKINEVNIKLVWSDGKIEYLVDIPEYLNDQLEAYFTELEELRSEDPQTYNMIEEVARHDAI